MIGLFPEVVLTLPETSPTAMQTTARSPRRLEFDTRYSPGCSVNACSTRA